MNLLTLKQEERGAGHNIWENDMAWGHNINWRGVQDGGQVNFHQTLSLSVHLS